MRALSQCYVMKLVFLLAQNEATQNSCSSRGPGNCNRGKAWFWKVPPETSAAKAGIERGDIILDLNGQPVNTPEDLSVHIAELAPGSVVHLKVSRNGQTRDVDVTLDQLSETTSASNTSETGTKALEGVEVQNLTPAIAHDLGISAGTPGVVVSSVDPSSAAAAADIERGDVIQEVNRRPVRNVAEYNAALSGTHNQSVLLLVKRGATTRYVVIQSQ